jgi:hypothetical protein
MCSRRASRPFLRNVTPPSVLTVAARANYIWNVAVPTGSSTASAVLVIAVAPHQVRPERVAIRAMVIEPAASSPTVANRRTGAGGSGRRRQPPRAGARPSETGAHTGCRRWPGLARRRTAAGPHSGGSPARTGAGRPSPSRRPGGRHHPRSAPAQGARRWPQWRWPPAGAGRWGAAP